MHRLPKFVVEEPHSEVVVLPGDLHVAPGRGEIADDDGVPLLGSVLP